LIIEVEAGHAVDTFLWYFQHSPATI